MQRPRARVRPGGEHRGTLLVFVAPGPGIRERHRLGQHDERLRLEDGAHLARVARTRPALLPERQRQILVGRASLRGRLARGDVKRHALAHAPRVQHEEVVHDGVRHAGAEERRARRLAALAAALAAARERRRPAPRRAPVQRRVQREHVGQRDALALDAIQVRDGVIGLAPAGQQLQAVVVVVERNEADLARLQARRAVQAEVEDGRRVRRRDLQLGHVARVEGQEVAAHARARGARG
mmetsp:Transcript_21241/g.64685  ORF Transcript_21241/g.64685 Transcript_21241/m.64685 type:complete len:239 (-) Transcript_21241:905-1621(-)